MTDYRRLEVGDEVGLVTGIAAAAVDSGGPPARPMMRLRVAHLSDDLIYCGEDDDEADWTFCRDTGWEIDDELGIGPRYGLLGSRIVLSA